MKEKFNSGGLPWSSRNLLSLKDRVVTRDQDGLASQNRKLFLA